MIVYVNANSEIKAVGSSSDASLTALEINDDANPFRGWTIAKICCYKVNVQGGYVTMMTPYVDSKLLEHFDQLGNETEVNASGVSENDQAICEIAELEDTDSQAIDELAEMVDTNSTAIDDLAELVDELLQEINDLKGGQ